MTNETKSISKDRLVERMNEALSGKFTRRTDKVTGRLVLHEWEKRKYSDKQIKSTDRYLWNSLYAPSRSGELEKKIYFPKHIAEQQGMLEAFVLIPEEYGVAEVERVQSGYFGEDFGFLEPRYQREAIEAIQETLSSYFEGQTNIFQKRFILDAAKALIPSNLGVFKEQYRKRMLNGLANTEFNREPEIEVLWANVTYGLARLGFKPEEDDFVKGIWEKSKTIPYGYLEGKYGAQEFIASAVMKKDPKGIVEFEYIRGSLPYCSLSHILSTIPVRKHNVEMRHWQIDRGYPGKEIHEPIVDFLDKTLSK